MRFTSTAEVKIAAHKFAIFKRALIRHAPREHRGIELGNITTYPTRREGAYVVAKVMIDSTVHVAQSGDLPEDWASEDSRSAADESIGYAIRQVGGEWGYAIDVRRAE